MSLFGKDINWERFDVIKTHRRSERTSWPYFRTISESFWHWLAMVFIGGSEVKIWRAFSIISFGGLGSIYSGLEKLPENKEKRRSAANGSLLISEDTEEQTPISL